MNSLFKQFFCILLVIIAICAIDKQYARAAEITESEVQVVKNVLVEGSEEIKPALDKVSPETNKAKDLQTTMDNLPWKGSTIFTPEQISQIYDAVIYRENNPNYTEVTTEENILIENNNTTDTQTVATTAPQPSQKIFSLNSILYYNDQSWSAWINNEVIRKLDSRKQIVIKNITDSSVSLMIQDINFDINASPLHNNFTRYNGEPIGIISTPAWKTLEEQQKQDFLARRKENFTINNINWEYKSKDGNILIDGANGVFQFTLHINQSFSTLSLNIYEGKNPLAVATTLDKTLASADVLLENEDNTTQNEFNF